MITTEPFNLGLGLEGTHCLITGAAGQIGRVVLQAFVQAGARVTAVDLRLENLPEYPKDQVRWEAADIRDETQMGRIFAEAADAFGVIATCVAIAGLDLSFIEHHATMADMSLAQWERTIGTNLTGTFLTSRAWMQGIREAKQEVKNCSLIMFSSEAALMGVRSNSDYSASKAGLQGLLLSLAPDVSHLGASTGRVNNVAPGAVRTPAFERECREDSNAKWVESQATVALSKQGGIPIDQIAYTCLYLASDRWSGSITGQTIRVDGGKSGKLFHLPDGNVA
jgi:NAD(P)-dependent dehydrogenase (short-subunit alcohol dehydrogenase family)